MFSTSERANKQAGKQASVRDQTVSWHELEKTHLLHLPSTTIRGGIGSVDRSIEETRMIK